MMRSPSRLQAVRLTGADQLREAQALRFRVFSQAFEARLPGAEDGLDRDDYDPHCLHIGVRDLESGALVATTRVLDHQAARGLGRFSSEGEFRSEERRVGTAGRACGPLYHEEVRARYE